MGPHEGGALSTRRPSRRSTALRPAELVEVRALAGDPSDNIPGVPGIGEKTALKLIAQYHSLENLLAHINDIKEKGLRAKLTEHADQARLSRRLTVLEPRCPWRSTWRRCSPGPPDREALRRLFVELEFSRFDQGTGGRRPPGRGLSLVTDRAGPGTGGRGPAGRQEPWGFISSWGSSTRCWPRWPGLALAWRTGEGASTCRCTADLAAELVWEILGPAMVRHRAIAKVGADLKAALLVLARFGPELPGAHRATSAWPPTC